MVTEAKSLTLARLTFKLFTLVVLATVRGAVPVVTLLVRTGDTTVPVTFKFPALMFAPTVTDPATFSDVSVPTEVKLELSTVLFSVVSVRVCALAATVPLAPRAIVTPFTVRLLFANLA